MQSSDPTEWAPRLVPPALDDLATRLADAGIETAWQGDGLLAALPRPSDSAPSGNEIAAQPPLRLEPRPKTLTLLCTANPKPLLKFLPEAVVTAAKGARLSCASPAGPIDLLPLGDRTIAEALPAFGLGALAFAWLPVEKSFCDPVGGLADWQAGILRGSSSDCLEALRETPRRLWIAARLLAECDLEPAPELVEAASAALDNPLAPVPEGAPARRELTRVLMAASPEPGLGFLRRIGLSASLFKGIRPGNESVVGRLEPDLALRWAAWLLGSQPHAAMRRMRVPIPLGKRIERLSRLHPIDTAPETKGEPALRRLLQKITAEDLQRLLAWRDAELADEPTSDASHMIDLRSRIDRIRRRATNTDRVRTLALDGKAVMDLTGCDAGRRVGEALAHLADFVARHPEKNAREPLEKELQVWHAATPESKERRRGARTAPRS